MLLVLGVGFLGGGGGSHDGMWVTQERKFKIKGRENALQYKKIALGEENPQVWSKDGGGSQID